MDKRIADEIGCSDTQAKRLKMLDGISPGDQALKFDFMISLQDIVSASIVNRLWMASSVQQRIVDLFRSQIKPEDVAFRFQWDILLDVVDNLNQLCLPTFMTKSLKKIASVSGSRLLNWIQYHDKIVFRNSKGSCCSAVDHLSYIKWTSRGRIGYAETARSILANECNGLNEDQKYKMACTYCLEDEIAALAPAVVGPSYLKHVHFDIHPMVYYWTAAVTGNDTKFDNPTYFDLANNPEREYGPMSINEVIFELLITSYHCDQGPGTVFNEVPIKYIWKKLSNEERDENLIRFCSSLETDDRISFLSSLEYNQQHDILKFSSGGFLGGILNDRLWERYFIDTALHLIEDTMDDVCYRHLLQALMTKLYPSKTDEINERGKYKSYLKQLFSKGTHLTNMVYVHHYYGFFSKLWDKISWDRDMDLIETILNGFDYTKKVKLIFDRKSFVECTKCIIENKWTQVNIIVNYLTCEKDVSEFKRKLIWSEGKAIAEELLEHETYDRIDYFLDWAFLCTKERNSFKQMLYCHQGGIICSMFTEDELNSTEAENLFQWCAKDDLNTVNEIKETVSRYVKEKALADQRIKNLFEELKFKCIYGCRYPCCCSDGSGSDLDF